MAARLLQALGCLGLLLTILMAGCDSIEPESSPFLVVEGFLEANKPLPDILLKQTVTLNQDLTTEPERPVSDAIVWLTLNDTTISYRPSTTTSGEYIPESISNLLVSPGSLFSIELEWQGQQATASGVIPETIELDSVQVRIPNTPVTAILVDTLRLDTPSVGATPGYIYLVEVDLWWTNARPTFQDSTFWIETRLRPQIEFSSKVLDVFLLSQEVQPEENINGDPLSRKTWTGVYAVPVTDSLSAIPDHSLTVQLVRGTTDYALFAASRNNPERREPISNIEGAIGIVAGISLDALEIDIVNGTAHAKMTQ